MWTKQPEAETPNSSVPHKPEYPGAPLSPTATARPGVPTARNLACLGSTLKIKGEIYSEEDLQIDGKVEGSISIQGHKLLVGRTGELSSDVRASEVIVYGKVTGNLNARDRLEINKHGEVIGDILTARIRIEDGAYFKGSIEIESAKAPVHADQDTVGVGAIAGDGGETIAVS
jgi:cytoskeletal protein CcmA (bactofilin family)